MSSQVHYVSPPMMEEILSDLLSKYYELLKHNRFCDGWYGADLKSME